METEKNIIVIGNDNRKRIKRGIDKMANAIKITLGAKGGTVLLFNKYGVEQLTKDGANVAKFIAGSLEDPVENAAATIASQVAQKVAELAGDGTTTASILIQAMYNMGYEHIKNGGNPVKIKEGMGLAIEESVRLIKELSVPADVEKLKSVALLSSNGDNEIADLIEDAIKTLGNDAVITVEESKGQDTYIDIIEGMEFENGYLSYHFVTNPEKRTVEYEEPLIYIYQGNINSIHRIKSVIEYSISAKKPLIILTNDIQGDVLNVLAINKLQRGLRVAVVRNPYFGDTRKEFLEDLEVYTGAKPVLSDTEEFNPDILGKVKKIIIKKDSTILIGDKGEDVDKRIEKLNERLESKTDTGNKDFIRERISKLTGGVAVIYVGSNTHAEMKEKYDRIEDAILAVRSAVEEGVVEGGGMTYVKVSNALKSIPIKGNDSPDVLAGIMIVVESLMEPFKQLINNSGENPDTILNKCNETNLGYDVKNGKYVNLATSGIIDSAKVSRVALENAGSLSSLLLTTGCSVVGIDSSK